MTTSTAKNSNLLPPGLVSNLQDVLLRRQANSDREEQTSSDGVEPGSEPSSSSSPPDAAAEPNSEQDHDARPVVLLTNGDGIESPGLTFLVEALVREGLCNVHVCAPQSDKSVSGHSVTLRETVAVTSTEINGATAYEVSGTPVDCVSLALSGALFSWSKPLLVISGINKGSSCGHHMFYSGVVAGARESLMTGVPSLSISLNWKKEESQDSDFKDAVSVCLPLINAAIRDIEKGVFPKNCLLNVEIPTSPLMNKDNLPESANVTGPTQPPMPCPFKMFLQLLLQGHPYLLDQWLAEFSCGFKLTKQSLRRSMPSWLAVSANRSAGRFMSNQQSLGLQLAQLSRDASAAGAARRLVTQKKNVEVVESVGVAGKSDPNRTVKYFRLEFLDKDQEDADEDVDFRALENGFIAITPISISPHVELDAQLSASEWISSALNTEQ